MGQLQLQLPAELVPCHSESRCESDGLMQFLVGGQLQPVTQQSSRTGKPEHSAFAKISKRLSGF
ncbi:GM25602 [Drosophila sechellia]|uniref:GM25602 n=1 Tax=Drosophila sechellia TaxID=7238 RepID=B4HJ44_DROSE|nr:GM25602 [Drosophila sechellia]